MFFLSSVGSGFWEVFLSLVAMFMAVFVAMPFHEFAHAFVAKKEGDYTATACKRCTLRGFSHMDWSGFFLMALFGFGWAKPVPVDERNFKRGRTSKFLVSIAGVVMNAILGTFFLFMYMLIYKISPTFYGASKFGYLLRLFLLYSYSLNFGLAIFNLLPLHPLDGYNIVESFCKQDNSFLYFMRRFSFIFFMIIILTDIYAIFYSVVINHILDFLYGIFGTILGL